VARTVAASGRESAEARRLKDSRRDIMAAFRAFAGPCLFVYGGADPEARPAWDLYRAFGEAHGLALESRFVADANHNFYAQAWSQEVEDAVVGFLTA